ncbi:MAG: ribonuclease HII [Lentisphaerae bacterium]|nr:ribonuclease HII [Lentisphaerota bacterium]
MEYERQHWEKGLSLVAGIDEAGRGPLAGPVMAAAVILEPDFAVAEEKGVLSGLTDSKKLSPRKREAFLGILMDSPSVLIGVGTASVEEIDQFNILRATHLAMRRAIDALPRVPEHVLIDGREVKGLDVSSTAIVGGDGKSLSIAGASVVAKVLRDRGMVELDSLYPVYGFARHKGYGSSAHIQALYEYGPAPVHRRSFRPVREAAAIHERRGDVSRGDMSGS